MINIELKLSGTNESKLHFWCASTNEGDKLTKEGAITVIQGNNQFDFDLNYDELNELIDYLMSMKDFIQEYNK